MTQSKQRTIQQKHGLTTNGKKHPIYKMRERMKYYCYTIKETNRNYPYWRGKGITMCDEWINNIKSFYNWCMENGWSKGKVIDRIDSDGNYCPENCQILTKSDHSKKSWAYMHKLYPIMPMSKLKPDQVKVIKEMLKLKHTHRDIAKLFGVGKSTITSIGNNETWKHVLIDKE